MLNSSDLLFFTPVFLLLAAAIGFGVWRGKRLGATRGFKAVAIAIVLGGFVLVILYAAVIAIYYAEGGH